MSVFSVAVAGPPVRCFSPTFAVTAQKRGFSVVSDYAAVSVNLRLRYRRTESA
ncbi:MAG: hypothetical protein MUE30_03800 [Spirosomaceae bacterium]|nr:hypothetical protein [Spirosomataceae bacterium]